MKAVQFSLNQVTKDYFNRRLVEFESDKMSYLDEQQLFQELQDSGYINELPQYKEFMSRLITVGLVARSKEKGLH